MTNGIRAQFYPNKSESESTNRIHTASCIAPQLALVTFALTSGKVIFKSSAFHVETYNSHHHHLLSYTATALLRYLFKNPTISWFKQFFMNIVGVILIPSHHIYNLYRIISIINYNFGSNFIKIFEKTCALLMYLYFLNFFESELVV